MQMRPRTRVALAMLTGVLACVSFVGYNQFYLSWLALTPLLLALRGLSPLRGALLGWLMGVTGHLGAYYWIVGLLRDFADMSAPLSVAGYVLLCLGQGGFYAVFAGVLCQLWRSGVRGGYWLAPVAHAGIELVYPYLFPHFWANSQVHFTPFMQIADLVGVVGMGFIMVLVGSVAAESIIAWRSGNRLPWRGWAAATVLVVGSVGYGLVRMVQVDAQMAAAPSLKVGVVQVNLGAADKHLPDDVWIEEHRAHTLALLEAEPDLDLVVWPEGAYNRLLPEDRENLRGVVQVGHEVPMLTGALRYEWDGPGTDPKLFNSAILLEGDGDVSGVYDKNHLLAFGEYLPWG